jgi:hypothetical protein
LRRRGDAPFPLANIGHRCRVLALGNGEPPKIPIADFPPVERQAIAHIGMLLLDLHSQVINFDAAFSLFLTSMGYIALLNTGDPKLVNMVPQKDPKLLSRWALLAGRDSAMTIYHFAKVLEAIRQFAFLDCPTFKSRIDHHHLRAAQKMSDRWFPDALSLRHAVAHSVELDKDLKSKARNARGILTIRNAYVGARFVNTHEGKVCSYEMSAQTLSRLKQVQDTFYKPFDEFDLIHHRRDQI